MIQIRRMREFTPDGETIPKKHDKPLSPDLYAETHQELFEQKLYEKIPEEDRINCYITVGHTKVEQKNREQTFQNSLFFDIDGIDMEKKNEYLEPIEKALLVSRDDILVICSGHGLHILLQTPNLILEKSKDYAALKGAYLLVCQRLDAFLRVANLPGKTDAQVFSANKFIRCPGTMNKKDGKDPVLVTLLTEGFKEHDFDLKKLAFGEADVSEMGQMDKKEFKRTKVDAASIEKECRFLRYAKENQADIEEPQWYAALSLLARLPDGTQKCHEYSLKHPGYTEAGTNLKIKQSLGGSGARTCEGISSLWAGCKECPHFGKIKTPLQIKADDFIASEENGFYIETKRGKEPAYGDLLKFFEKKHTFRVHKDSEQVYIFDKTHYVPYKRPELRQFAAKNFSPEPKDYIAKEFLSWVTRSNLIDEEWFQEVGGYINFKNGVLKTDTGELLPHSPEWGFLYCLPFNFDPNAKSPVFDSFLAGVTRQDKDLAEVILEFTGYALCDREYWLQKSIVFVGRGSNGKTTLLKIIEALVGKKNFSTLSMNDLQNENMRSQLEGKLINICDEFPQATLKNTEMFKKLMGGTVMVKQLYQNPKTITNNAKFFYSCNELPRSRDHSHGYFRRLTIVPFKAQFNLEDGTADRGLLKKMYLELPGIFNRVFEAYKTLSKRGSEVESLSARRAFEGYKADLNWVDEWFKDTFEIGPIDKEVNLSYALLHEKFDTACGARREKQMPRQELFAQLKQFLPDFDERKGQLRMGADRPRVLYGVRLKQAETETAAKEPLF